MSAVQPSAQEPLAPQQDVSPVQHAAPANKYSAANDLMFEDCLKSIMLKSKTGKTYCSYKNKLCPKAMQSPFGDFPAGYLPKKSPEGKSTPFDTTASSMSTSSMHSKSLWHNA